MPKRNLKKCSACREMLPAKEFAHYSPNVCRECLRARRKDYYRRKKLGLIKKRPKIKRKPLSFKNTEKLAKYVERIKNDGKFMILDLFNVPKQKVSDFKLYLKAVPYTHYGKEGVEISFIISGPDEFHASYDGIQRTTVIASVAKALSRIDLLVV